MGKCQELNRDEICRYISIQVKIIQIFVPGVFCRDASPCDSTFFNHPTLWAKWDFQFLRCQMSGNATKKDLTLIFGGIFNLTLS